MPVSGVTDLSLHRPPRPFHILWYWARGDRIHPRAWHPASAVHNNLNL